MYVLEVILDYGSAVRGQFTSKQRAENARKKISAEMGKGKFRNDSDVVEVKTDSTALSVRASNVIAVQIVDDLTWNRLGREAAEASGLPWPGKSGREKTDEPENG